MSYKIPNIPSPQAYIEERADFWEINALLNVGRFYGSIEMGKALSMPTDELEHEGIESEEDGITEGLDSVYAELQNRGRWLSTKYPYEFGSFSLKHHIQTETHTIYLFLLFCTRLNMLKNKVQDNIDATRVFEKLCALVARTYFGENADSFVFGTAEPDSFENKITKMIKRTGEGHSFKNPNRNNPTKNDDAVDVVVWKEFADHRKGKLMGFGQCKTGTSWQDSFRKLDPGRFCDNWLLDSPILKPIPLIFIADTLNRDKNFHSQQQDYLFFNRFRIMEYLPQDLPTDLLGDIKKWVEATLQNVLN